MELFYSAEINSSTILLRGEEAKHCVKSLRHKKGDVVYVGDGCGSIYECIIEEEKGFCTKLHIIKKKRFCERKKPFLHIAISPLKNPSRMEWFVEKATELGVDAITFINCHRTEKKNINLNRIKNIIISAGKQSMQQWFPEVRTSEDFNKFILSEPTGKKLIAHAGAGNILLANVIDDVAPSATLLIGPEGDFTEREVEVAVHNGFTQVSLGNQRFRTETAGIFVACYFSILKAKYIGYESNIQQ